MTTRKQKHLKSVSYLFRLTPNELKLLKAAARKSGATVSEYIRVRCLPSEFRADDFEQFIPGYKT